MQNKLCKIIPNKNIINNNNLKSLFVNFEIKYAPAIVDKTSAIDISKILYWCIPSLGLPNMCL